MDRTPNYRFSISKDRTITPFESVVDSIKRHVSHPFARTSERQESFKQQSTESPYSMASRKQQKKDRPDPWGTADESRQDTEHIKQSNGNGSSSSNGNSNSNSNGNSNGNGKGKGKSNGGGDRDWNKDSSSAIPDNRRDDEISEGRGSSDAQSDPGFDPYLALIKNLRTKLEASRIVTEEALLFYTSHQAEIQKVESTRQQLKEVTTKSSEYKMMITNLRIFAGEKEQEFAEKTAVIQKDQKDLDVMREEVARHMQQLEDEKRQFKEATKKKEEEHLSKLQEERLKLESKHTKQHDKRMDELEKTSKKREDDLEKATKKSQDDDRKTISNLQIKNDKLVQDLEEQRLKLKTAEKKCKDTEKLRTLSENEADDLNRKLKIAENEFGLSSKSTEYFESEFLKIRNDVHAISLRYVDQIKVDDVDAAVRDKIEKADEDFIFVPISNTMKSKELCLIHFQRVISSQLQAVLWQLFSSDITMDDPKQTSLLNQIYNGLVKNPHESKSNFRAARTYAALTIRGLHSKSTSTRRVDMFTENIMNVISLLLNPKIHPALRKDLTNLATSAISLWTIVQTDERELQVHSTLDPASFEKPEEDIDVINSRVFVSFPCVIARGYPQIDNAPTVGPPGGFETELQIEEICIHKGVGTPEWDSVVRAGDEEETQRKNQQEIESNEEEIRKTQERIKNLSKPDLLGHMRGSSYSSRRNSVVGAKLIPLSPSPTSAWAQKMPERG